MKKKFVDFVTYILVAVGIGAIISTVCMFLLNSDLAVRDTLEQTGAWLIASALFGVISKIYDCDILPLPLAMAIHMGCCLLITLTTCWLLGYAELGGNFFLAIIPIFVVIYVLIAGFVFWADYKNAKEVNERLK